LRSHRNRYLLLASNSLGSRSENFAHIFDRIGERFGDGLDEGQRTSIGTRSNRIASSRFRIIKVGHNTPLVCIVSERAVGTRKSITIARATEKLTEG